MWKFLKNLFKPKNKPLQFPMENTANGEWFYFSHNYLPITKEDYDKNGGRKAYAVTVKEALDKLLNK